MSAEENKPKITPLGLCQAGQDTVQEITQKTHEMFQALKLTQLPNGTVTGTRNAQDRIMKLKDLLAKMDPLFKRLRVIYTECQKHTSDLEQYKGNLVPLMSNSGNGGSDKENPPKSAREQVICLS
ncbi:unnamed protein product [Clavelina lepadiformis]|uniref:Mediator of RNA polymerase II transcription subunit 30 n=1 Tax=Clavelina lepadiformis TaxID=159417 RepID=A0ABP0GHY8_CLALP